MSVVNTRLVHILMSMLYLLVSGVSFVMYYMLSSSNSILEFKSALFSYSTVVFSLDIDMSSSSLLFMSVVSLITSVVIIFSFSYMSVHYHSFFFLIMLNLFVISMMFVISFKNLFVVMLGWDGLGVISFFLILYYQSPYSVFSAWFTILMNRLGDSFLIISIVLLIFSDLTSLGFYSYVSSSSLILLFTLMLGLMTKSAIFPFSPWLPVAMSAPTPISSLVHSSTLVTAGLYLMMRMESLISLNGSLMEVLMWLSLFTSLYAGLGALVESDLKKLVALSTLSHLGFICMSFSSGMLTLAYFHLLAHALFKSLLFMGVGDWISSGHHYQDSRALSSGMSLTPLSSYIIMSSLLSLMGIPFMVGFYSKDMVLESLFYSNMSLFYMTIMYLNVFLTFMYTMRVVKYSLLSLNQPSPLYMVSLLSLYHYMMLGILSLISYILPMIYTLYFDTGVMLMVSFFHYTPLLLLFICMFTVWISWGFTWMKTGSVYGKLMYFGFSHMINMATLYSSGVSLMVGTLFINVSKTFELGVFNHLSQSFLVMNSNLSSMKFISVALVFVPMILVMVLILLMF